MQHARKRVNAGSFFLFPKVVPRAASPAGRVTTCWGIRFGSAVGGEKDEKVEKEEGGGQEFHPEEEEEEGAEEEEEEELEDEEDEA